MNFAASLNPFGDLQPPMQSAPTPVKDLTKVMGTVESTMRNFDMEIALDRSDMEDIRRVALSDFKNDLKEDPYVDAKVTAIIQDEDDSIFELYWGDEHHYLTVAVDVIKFCPDYIIVVEQDDQWGHGKYKVNKNALYYNGKKSNDEMYIHQVAIGEPVETATCLFKNSHLEKIDITRKVRGSPPKQQAVPEETKTAQPPQQAPVVLPASPLQAAPSLPSGQQAPQIPNPPVASQPVIPQSAPVSAVAQETIGTIVKLTLKDAKVRLNGSEQEIIVAKEDILDPNTMVQLDIVIYKRLSRKQLRVVMQADGSVQAFPLE